MTVTFDSAGGGNAIHSTTTTPSTSWSHNITTSGADTCVVVPVAFWYQGSLTSLGATYNGVSMTMVNELDTTLGGFPLRIRYLQLFNPPTGSQTVAISGVDNGTSDRYLAGISLAYKGVGTVITGGTNSGTSTTPTITVTSPSGEIALSAAVTLTGQTSPNQTPRYYDGAQTFLRVQEAAGTGSATFNSTISSGAWVDVGLRLQPPASTNTSAFFGMFP